MKCKGHEGFHFDKVQIISLEDKETLKAKLPFDVLTRESRFFDIQNNYNPWVPCSSRIEVVAPTQRFLEILMKCEAILLPRYIITHIEIAHDEYQKSRNDAENAVDKLSETMRKKYSFAYICRKGEDEFGNKKFGTKAQREKERRRGLFASRTLYAVFKEENKVQAKKRKKPSRLNYAVYPRHSKINWAPCIHSEWRIIGSATIKKVAGIAAISDMVLFDFEKFFALMQGRYIVHEVLDNEALGMWLMNLDGRRSVTREQKSTAKFRAVMFRRGYGIMTYSDLRRFLKGERKRIEGTRGARSEWATNVVSLSNVQRFRRAL